MKKTTTLLFLVAFTMTLSAQDLKVLPLNAHSTVKGSDLMEAFQNRQSARSMETTDLSLQDLSDLVWAANGVNRPESGKRTAPSAMDSRDVDVYVCRADGAYLYDAVGNSLKQITTQDVRPLLDGRRSTGAPVILLITSDLAKFRSYKPDSSEEYNKHTYEMGCLDAGIVSQNIALYCAGTGLATVPRAQMDQKALREALKLSKTQMLWLNHPVGFPKK
jgi:nitroreductase